MRIQLFFQDTRANKEDFAITPYLFGCWLKFEVIGVYGLGICWGFYALFIGIGTNIPKHYPILRIKTLNKDNFKNV